MNEVERNQKILEARKSGTSTVLSLTGFIENKKEYVVREMATPLFSDNRFLQISEKSKDSIQNRIVEYKQGSLKFAKKSNSVITKEGIEEIRTSDGKLITRQKTMTARRESTSTVLSLTGFIDERMTYLVTDLGGGIIIIKEYEPNYDKIAGESYEAERQMHAEIEAEIEAKKGADKTIIKINYSDGTETEKLDLSTQVRYLTISNFVCCYLSLSSKCLIN